MDAHSYRYWDEIMKALSRSKSAPPVVILKTTAVVTSECWPMLRAHRTPGMTERFEDFPGAVLIIASAKSAAGMRSMALPQGWFFDEPDAFPPELDAAGNPTPAESGPAA